MQQIEVITSLGHLSKVILSNQEEYLLDMRLKELKQFEANGLFRINNSTILNLSQISSFRSGDYARLEVYTKNDKKYLVSRHYAKLIKERLS
ncbi:LytTR family DNA-binding domain-containing protein [Bacillus coahuilensis]|uniref:LytTR family DNA-binding domain-containing protein n=1 Tax=Bacillus coahuilensis TaxID=408580 RepID=UPI003B431088